MGTKRTNRTIEDSLQLRYSPTTPNRVFQSSEWISRETRLQAGAEIQPEVRDREAQSTREMDRIRERTREGRRDVKQDDRERERLRLYKGRAVETELKERPTQKEKGGYTIERDALTQFPKEYIEKGDTFPRSRRRSGERERRVRHSVDQGYGRDTEWLREVDIRVGQKKKERENPRREKDRDIERHKEKERIRYREDINRNNNGRLDEGIGWDGVRRERGGKRQTEGKDQQIISNSDFYSERDRPVQRKDRFYSPQKDKILEGDRANYSDRDEYDELRRENRRQRHRYTKSEGDSDSENERHLTKEQHFFQQKQYHSKSQDDGVEERARKKYREKEMYKDMRRQKKRYLEQEKDTDAFYVRNQEQPLERYEEYVERDRKTRDWKEVRREPNGQKNQAPCTVYKRKINDTERDHKSHFTSEREMILSSTFMKSSGEDEATAQHDQTQGMIQEEAPSRESKSGSDAETNQKSKEIKDNGSYLASELDKNEMENKKLSELIKESRDRELSKGTEKEEIRTDQDKEKNKPQSKQRPYRKMWLEPRSGNETSESLLEEYRKRETAKERYAQRYKEQNTFRNEDGTAAEKTCRGAHASSIQDMDRELARTALFVMDDDRENLEEEKVNKETEEFIFEHDRSLDTPLKTEAKNLAKDMEGGYREYKLQGDDNSEGGERSEGEWDEGKERLTSADDGFVTVSSGGDEDEADEDKFEDCKEYWDGGDGENLTRQLSTTTLQREKEIEPNMAKARSDHTVTVFCVVGQTLPRSESNQNLLTEDHLEQEATSKQDADVISDFEKDRQLTGDVLTFPEEEMASNHENELSHCVTNAEEVTIPVESVTNNTEPSVTIAETHTVQEKEGEEKMDKICHLEESSTTIVDKKRFSAAPHVKWAKNVLNEILDSSEDETLNIPEGNDKAPSVTENQSNIGAPASPLYGIVNKPRKHSHQKRYIDSESLHSGSEDANVDTLVGNKIVIQIEGEMLEQLQHEDAAVETDDDIECYTSQISPDMNSFSSGEEGKEEISKTNTDHKKKPVWKILSSTSLRDFGGEAWSRRKGVRKTLQKHTEEKDEGGQARDRRTRVFPSDDENDEFLCNRSESDLSFRAKISRSGMRNSKFYNAQLYQLYSEVVQDRELHHQSHSDASSVFGEVCAIRTSTSPCPTPPLARRPLPPIPSLMLPQSLSHSDVYSNVNEPHSLSQSSSQRSPSPLLSKSFALSPMLWQDLPGVRNSPEIKNLSENERRLQEVRFEVVTSEASYCSSLDIVIDLFVKSKQLDKIQLTSQDKNWLFSRLCDVRVISQSFYTQLEERVESDIMHFTVCDIIIKHCPRFRSVYVPYLTNQSYQDKTYQRLMNENSGFRHLVEKLEQSPRCQRLPFRSFLILPFQRITRLKLLVQNIVKRTAPKTKDEAQAIKAMKLLEKMIKESNDSISQMRNIESLVSLNAKVDFECKTLPLISQSRRLVREGPVTELLDFPLKEKERTTYMHLFNDYLLFSLPKDGGRFTVIDHAPVSELRAENCRFKLHSLQKNVFRVHTAHKSFLLRTDSQADKLRWISALSRPHPEIDLSAAQDIIQMHCIKAYVAQQPDELSVEKADILLVLQQSSDGWVEGTRLSDRLRGWVPEAHLEIIKSEKARQNNLIDALKITIATATG